MLTKKELQKYVGKKIREYRVKNKLTQEQVGEKIGVKNNMVSAYERGASSPHSDTFFALAALFGVRVDDFFPPVEYNEPHLHLEKTLERESMNVEEMRFLQKLIEKTLSLEGEEREKFLESIKLSVDFYNRLYKD
ncbi:helix-turn-helix domain-containing protein [Sporosarcina highlanderae]|uniref:Helix-turn-helix domain-containing protein n=1 Tax=Sporosarcina highlanderae TaxID=3035916 RepID=A0ABT8JVJ7_9BACL|nr:helix-turn-helix domain-containing protein [Sporosarcina highlanderae]MDN4609165.1 helix-turn-helix domain-containing protein [Sporosarcina highlanderae]